MTESDSQDMPVTFVNVFEIPREDVETFTAGWRRRAELMASQTGFRDAQLLEATSDETRFQLVNIAHWDSEQAWREANADQRMRAAVSRVGADPGQRATPNIGLYRPVVVVTAPR